MASGDNHQWGFSAYPQASEHGAVQRDYLGHPFQRDGDDGGNINTNSFGLAHQWQTPQDNQFMQQNGFSFQPQSQNFPAQQYSNGSSHTQASQHPQAFSSSISLEGPSEISWDYGFGFETNPLAGLGEDGGSFANQLPAASNANGVPSTSPYSQAMPDTMSGQQTRQIPQQPQQPAQKSQQYQQQQQQPHQPHQQHQQAQQAQQPPQPQHLHHQQLPQQHPHPHQQQHQLNAGHTSAQVYAPAQVAGFGRNMQQSQAQSMAQTRSSRPVAGEFSHSVASQQQQHQPTVPQQQHQQPNPLQAGARQNHQLQSLNQPQQISRVGTPQSMTPINQASQSPFSGRVIPPMPMQQQQGSQNQFPGHDARGGPAVPFSVPQQTSMTSTSANISNNPTTQSRFMPSQLVTSQRPLQSPVPQANPSALPNTIPRGQQDSNYPTYQPMMPSNVMSNSQLGNQSRTGTPLNVAAAWAEQQRPGIQQPRVSRVDENAIPVCGSRYVSFAFTAPLQIDPDLNEYQTVRDVIDPSEYAGPSVGNLFPSVNGQTRILAAQIFQDWASALVQGDLTGQVEQEKRLRQHFGGSMPKRYEDKLEKLKTLHQKSLAARGPERSKTRPAKEADAAEWDALGVIYLTNSQPSSADIGAAVAQYGKLIRVHSAEFAKLKARLKNVTAADEAALKEQISKKLDTVHRVVAAANAWGDPQVVANLGGNQKLISDFVSCLIYANNTGDHNGQLPKDVLRLMAQITTIDREFLMDSLQFAKIGKRFESKGDAEVKGFVKAIKENAKTKEENAKLPGSGDERTSTPDTNPTLKMSNSTDGKATSSAELAKKKATSTVGTRAPSTSSSIKRARDEESDTKAVKRIAAEPTNPQNSQPGGKVVPSKVVVAAPNTSGTKLFGSGMLGGKTKTLTKPTSKPVAVKVEGTKIEAPNTKIDAKKEPAKPAKLDVTKGKKTEPVKMEASTASKLGGIGALLDEISNSKPKPIARATPDRDAKVDKDETPEEKARRLRKEKRRHLRVTWKEGEALTEIREFHKDVDEDEGRASNMIRDARDDRSEGMQLRKANQAQFEDEDEDEPSEEWSPPTAIDFSAISQDQRNKNSVVRGGLVKFETEQQKLIAEREKTELMVVYTDPTDIPPTPKSPHTSSEEDTDMQTGTVYNLAQDDPKVAEVNLRWAEAGSRGLSWARLTAVRRAQKGQSATLSDVANMPSQVQPSVNSTVSTSQARPTLSPEEQILVLLTSERIKNYTDPDPYDPAHPKTQRRHDYADPELQRAVDDVENLVELMKGKPYPPTEPPEWMKNDTSRTAEWWQGYNKDKQRAEQQAQQQQIVQAAQAAPPVPIPQREVPTQAAVPTPHQTPQAVVDPNLAAWMALAQLQQHAQAQPNAYAQAYRDAYSAAYQNMQPQLPQQQMVPAQVAEDPNAKLQAALATLSAVTTTPNQQQPVLQQNSSDPEIQALLTSLAQTAAQQPAQTYPAQSAQFQAPAPNDPNMLAYIMALAANQTPGQSEQQALLQQQQMLNNNGSDHQRDDSRERSSRKRERDPEEDHDGMHPARREKTRGHNKGARGGDIPPHLRGINRDKIGTKPCTFWAKGQCQKGEQCTFRHD